MPVDYGQYESIMEQLKEDMPTLADQLEQEVRHGRAVSEQELRQEADYEERASRLAATDLPSLGKTDIAVIPYTGDERIELIREALVTLAETMYATRRTALETAIAHETGLEIQFGDPELEPVSRLDLRDETERAKLARQKVLDLLMDESERRSEAAR